MNGHLDAAIDAHTRGFESDPRTCYPGINAVTLLIHRGINEGLAKAQHLLPIPKFAFGRRATATAGGYWDAATLLEVACCECDWKGATLNSLKRRLRSYRPKKPHSWPRVPSEISTCSTKVSFAPVSLCRS
ncbi:MAG TPA: TRAFs-binding domain-containing protein [Terrimicrobiaceae bacterium]